MHAACRAPLFSCHFRRSIRPILRARSPYFPAQTRREKQAWCNQQQHRGGMRPVQEAWIKILPEDLVHQKLFQTRLRWACLSILGSLDQAVERAHREPRPSWNPRISPPRAPASIPQRRSQPACILLKPRTLTHGRHLVALQFRGEAEREREIERERREQRADMGTDPHRQEA